MLICVYSLNVYLILLLYYTRFEWICTHFLLKKSYFFIFLQVSTFLAFNPFAFKVFIICAKFIYHTVFFDFNDTVCNGLDELMVM